MRDLEAVKKYMQDRMPETLGAALGMELTRLDPEMVEGRMPVDKRTHQPMGFLHGGASVAFAETLASIGANLNVDATEYAVGLEINANHLRSVRSGWVQGRATPVHRGKKTQVWSIEIRDESGSLVCISRITLAVLTRK